jgi:hypothetical protein
MHRLVIAATTLLALTGAVVVGAYLFLFAASSDRLATLAPERTAFYVNVYLQPSTGQQMNLAGRIGRIPGFEDTSTLDEKIDQIAENLLSGSGIDYRTDVKPWLGNQLAIAAWPGGEQLEAQPVLLAEVKDRAAAEASIVDVASDTEFRTETYGGVDLHLADGTAYAFVDDRTLVVAPDAADLQAVVDVAGGDPDLASRTDFRTTMDSLPADHLASVFVDLAAIAEATDTAEQLAAVSTAGAALVAERDGIRLSGSAPFDMQDAGASSKATFALGTEPSSLVDWMPDDTVAELVVFGLRQTLEDAEAAVQATPEGQDVTSTLDAVRAIAAFGLGVDLDKDILPLLDREVAIAISGVDGDLPTGQLLLRPDDPDAAEQALDRVADGLVNLAGATRAESDVDGVTVSTLDVPDVATIAWTRAEGLLILGLRPEDVAAAVRAHDSGEALGATDAYRRTFEVAGARAGNEAWVDVQAAIRLLGADADLPQDARDILGQIGAFGFTAPSRSDQIEFHAVVTVDDRTAE